MTNGKETVILMKIYKVGWDARHEQMAKVLDANLRVVSLQMFIYSK